LKSEKDAKYVFSNTVCNSFLTDANLEHIIKTAPTPFSGRFMSEVAAKWHYGKC